MSEVDSRARFSALCKRARDDDSVVSELLDEDVPLALEALQDLEHRHMYGAGSFRLGLEALRRVGARTPAFEGALGAACIRAGSSDDVAKVAELLTKLPLAQRSALLVEQISRALPYGGLDARRWLVHCPSLAILALCAQREKDPARFHSLVGKVDDGSALVRRAVTDALHSFLTEGRFGVARTPAALRTLLVEYFAEGDNVDADAAQRLVPLFEAVFRDHCATEAFANVFAGLPLGAREAVALRVALEGTVPFDAVVGPHAYAATEKVAAKLLAEVLDGEGDVVLIASRALESFPIEVVEPVLREHEVPTVRAENWLETTRWFLEIGVMPACSVTPVCDHPTPPISRIVQLGPQWGRDDGRGWCVRDLVADGDRAVASTSAGVVAIVGPDETRVLIEPRENDDLLPCRIAAVTRTEIAVWGWEHLSVVKKESGDELWSLYLGHGNDEDVGACHVSGPRLRVPEGTYVNLEEKDWDSEFSNVEEGQFRLAAGSGDGFLLARMAELYRWSPTGLEQRHSFPARIVSIDGAVVMNDGSLADYEGTPLVPYVGSEGLRDAVVQRTAAWTGIVASYGERSVVSVWSRGDRVFERSYEGVCHTATGRPGVVVVPGGVLLLGSQTSMIPIPALRPSAAACTTAHLLVGTETGQVLVLDWDAIRPR
ncbi:MAG: hypothetical protein AAGE52_13880 [Myxococcota bacterium]